MTPPPRNVKIYHITHVDNLAGILNQGNLWSDSERRDRSLECHGVGMPTIKSRRLDKPVPCHDGTAVGDYVPFYFCPRSVMLFILHKRNHPDLEYVGGQKPVLQLEADLGSVIAWAQQEHVPWAFTDRNAAARYCDFFDSLSDLDKVDWEAVATTTWNPPEVKEAKQAEFLVYRAFPWELVECIGVYDQEIQAKVLQLLSGAAHRPAMGIHPEWYY